MTRALDIAVLRQAVSGYAAAFRSITMLQPAGGQGDKVFPPTYSGGQYAVEKRRLPGRDDSVDCVLLDSVQSQANRMELALLEAWERGELPLPVISVDFRNQGLLKPLRVTSLETPHRIADALLRDSLLYGTPFRKSQRGALLDQVDMKHATPLFELCPTALVFGLWDSTGPRGGLGAKFARAMVSEIVGIDAVAGVKSSSRIDPAEIIKNAGPVFRTPSGDWTLNPSEALVIKEKRVLFKKVKGKDVFFDNGKMVESIPDAGRPSVINHGNVTPDLVIRRDKNGNPILVDGKPVPIGGFTIDHARRTITLSLPALRRLRFPVDGEFSPECDLAARVVLVALGLCAATLARDMGGDLRSRCHLVAETPGNWELIDRPGEKPQEFVLEPEQAISLYKEAVMAARVVGLPWLDEELKLIPSPQLVALVRRSQELAASLGETAGED
jgi:CRISPR-associated protein Csb1